MYYNTVPDKTWQYSYPYIKDQFDRKYQFTAYAFVDIIY